MQQRLQRVTQFIADFTFERNFFDQQKNNTSDTFNLNQK